METSKKMMWLIGILAVMNLVLIGFLVRPHLPGFGQGGPPDANLNREADVFMERQIGLSRDQIDSFERARSKTKAEFDSLRDQLRLGRQRLAMSLFDNPTDPAVAERLLDDLASCSRRIEAVTFLHLKEVQTFCNPDQNARFKRLLEDVFRDSERRPPPPPRR